MVFCVENKNTKIVIPKSETYVKISKGCENFEFKFHDNVESLFIEDDCEFSIEKIKSFNLKNLKNLKLCVMKNYDISGFDKLELLVLPSNNDSDDKIYKYSLKINNPSLNTLVLRPDSFKTVIFYSDVENVYSYTSRSSISALIAEKYFFSKNNVKIDLKRGNQILNCVFFDTRFYHEKLIYEHKESKSDIIANLTKETARTFDKLTK